MTSMGDVKGRWIIADEHYPKFLDLLHDYLFVKKGRATAYVEQPRKGEPKPLLIDLDFKYNGEKNLQRTFTEKNITDFIQEIIKVLINEGTEADFEFISKTFSETPMSQAKFSMADKFGDFLIKLNDLKNVKKGIDQMVALRNMLPAQYRKFVDSGFKKTFDKIIKAKGKEIEDYVNTVFK